MRVDENVIKHKAIGREWDVMEQLSNFAFSARLTKESSEKTKTQTSNINDIAAWQAVLITTKQDGETSEV